MDEFSCPIHEILPTELLQNIFLQSAPTLTDLLRISSTCQIWRKLIFNPFMIEHYFKFDEKYRRKGLVKWWNFNDNIDDPTDNPFYSCRLMDCFLGRCASLPDGDINFSILPKTDFLFDINRGENYSIALWLNLHNLDSGWLFMVSDNDWDYTRSNSLELDKDQHLSIGFQSPNSFQIVPSTFKAESKVWYHVVIVQDSEIPEQTVWVNGQLVLTTPVPVAAYTERAAFSFMGLVVNNHSVADLSLWSRCLSSIEIRAIYDQQTSIDKVDVVRYIFQHTKA